MSQHKFNVLFVIDGFYAGGAQRVVVDLVLAAVHSSVVVPVVAVSQRDGPLLDELDGLVDVRVFGAFRGLLDAFGLSLRLSRICKNDNIDLVISHMSHVNKSVLRAKFLMPHLPPVVIVEHTDIRRLFIGARSRFKRFFRPLETRFLYQRASKIITVSSQISLDLFLLCSLRKERFLKLHNPIKLDRVCKTEGTPQFDPFDFEGKTVISVGRFDQVKNFPLLIRAFSSATKRRGCREDRLLLVGDGPRRQQLKDLVLSLDIEEQVVFCGFQRDVFPFLRSSDVFVSTSHFEGLGNAMLEAIACGCPCIAVKTAGSQEIANYVGGISLLDQGDEDGLSQKIYEHLENPTLQVSESDKAFVAGLSPDRVWLRYEDVITQVLEK